MMEQTLLGTYRLRLDSLMRDGRRLRQLVTADVPSPPTIIAIRSWQQACATAVNELSGGNKSHWLARAFSQAFLVRSISGEAVREAPLDGIIERLVGVLEQADRSLAQVADQTPSASASSQPPRRFEFVHNSALRPVLEQAYLDARRALADGDCDKSFITTCGVLEAVITDALDRIGEQAHERSFQTRIEAAQAAGLIRGGCARLPVRARNYRDLVNPDGELQANVNVTAHEARTALQVLQVVMRDLDPGR